MVGDLRYICCWFSFDIFWGGWGFEFIRRYFRLKERDLGWFSIVIRLLVILFFGIFREFCFVLGFESSVGN